MINTPRDTFLYLLSIVTLVASAVSFGMVAYGLINLNFPDVLNNPYYYSRLSDLGAIRAALATLIVVFPVFIWVSQFLRKDIEKHPEKKDLRVRRWLMYLTVFVAGLLIIGDLVALIRNFLEGDLTTRFILKVITILFIATSAFWYYLAELQEKRYPRKAFKWTVMAIVAAVIVYGFVLAGSPQNQRLVRLDDQKVSHLQMIQDRLIYYWQQKGGLPTSLSELEDPISGFTAPTDPQTGQQYEYQRTGAKNFQLCASFNLFNSIGDRTSIVRPDYPYAHGNWFHGAGRACFDRSIDESLYPVKPIK